MSQKIAKSLSEKYHTTISVKGVSFSFFNKLVLDDVLIEDQQKDSLLFVHELVASIDSFSIKKRSVAIDKLKLNKTSVYVDFDKNGVANYQFLADAFKSSDTLTTDTLGFNFKMKQFLFNEAKVHYAYWDSAGNHKVEIENISLGISDLHVGNNDVAFDITGLSLNDRESFKLEDFSAKFSATPDSVCLTKLHLSTLNSELTEANLRFDKSKIGKEFNLNKLRLSIDLKSSRVSLKDLSILIPSIKGMDEDVFISGQLSGTPADLKGKNIELGLGENTRLSFDFYLNGLPDLHNTYMHFDLKQSFADFNDLIKVKLPDLFSDRNLVIPDVLLQAGVVEYNGNFTGFLSDFVAYGTFRSKWGVLTTDLSFVPSPGEKLKIKGCVKTVDFMVGKLIQTNDVDRITFVGDVQGLLNPQTRDFFASVSGKIDSLTVKDYQYKDISLSGDVQNRKFDGSLVVNDPNLRFRFDGVFDFNKTVPQFNFGMFVEKADLAALKLDQTYKKSDVSFALNANFVGDNIDNLSGTIHFKEGAYTNENGTVSFDNFDLKTFYENESVLQVRSDFLDADIRGQYQLHNLGNSVRSIISHYLPSAGFRIQTQLTNNSFDFRFNIKDVNRFTRILVPELKVTPAIVQGSINADKNTLILNANFPEIQYKSTVFKKISVNADGGSKLNIRNKIEEIAVGDKFKMYNMSLFSSASDDVMDSRLSWNNSGDVTYSGSLNASTRFFERPNRPHVEINVKPSKLYVADSLWLINSSLITVDSTLVRINKLKLSSRGQSILADGAIDKGQTNKLNIQFDKIDLNTLNTFIGDDLELRGQLDGTLSLFDIYNGALFLSDLKINNLSLLEQPIGNSSIQCSWDPVNENIVADVLVESNNKKTLLASGIYNPEQDSLSINTNFDHFSLLILQPLLGSSFANVHGDATGKVRLYGSLDHLQHDGALFAANAGLKLSDLQVNYHLNDSVRFRADKIIFPDMKVTDDYGNTGLFYGSIKHRSFSKMVYDLTVKSDRIMAINTTPEINEQFYGKTFCSGIVRITGKGATVLIDGVARTEKGTDMKIYLEYEEDAQEYDFLNFVSRGYQPKQQNEEQQLYNSDLQMKFNVEITPEAKAQLIYNSKIGDVIRSQGSGSMHVAIDNNNNLSLFGEYTVDQGDYLFTLQNVINKKFEIQRGGTIEWNGDPREATLDLNAIYRLKASLGELFANTTDNKNYTQRIPVLCKIALSKNLNNPDIKFDIDLPSAEDRVKDEVRQYISSDEDMNRQIFSLLVMGKFYTPEYLRGTYTTQNTNLMGTTVSELASNQLSNWLSMISNDFNVGVNYRPGNQITDDEVELALSTQIFNDRVSINGNIGNTTTQRTSNNNNGLIGDADINVKLSNNGKLQFKAYNHSNNNLIYETSPYTQGVGFSYREDFNDIEELWKKLKSLFNLKGKKALKK